MPALALTDHDNLCAAVKFTSLCEAYHVKPILGAEVTMEDETHLTLLSKNRTGYANLCRLLSHSHLDNERLNPHLSYERLAAHTGDLICLTGCRKGRVASFLHTRNFKSALESAKSLRDWFGADNTFIEMQDDETPGSHNVCRNMEFLAKNAGVKPVATNNVHYLTPNDFIIHDFLRCIANGTTFSPPHPDRPLNGERYFKSTKQMRALFEWCPQAVSNTLLISDQCEPALPKNEDIHPMFPVPEGFADAPAYLRHLAVDGLRRKYGKITAEAKERLKHELSVICGLGFADYTLMVREIVTWARSQDIFCSLRGSAVDSFVSFCLGLTEIDALKRQIPFARFLVEGKKPDFDLDFPHNERDRVFGYIIEKYGERFVGMVCTFSSYLAKSTLRDFGKVMELPTEALEFFTEHMPRYSGEDIAGGFDRFAELKPFKHMADRFALLFDICKKVAGFPRHIATHSSGIVISRVPLDTIAPLQPSARGITNIWTLDKDDAEDVGAVKLDVLCLRMLAGAADAEQDIRRHEPAFSYDMIPWNDSETFQMFRDGAAVGSFQFESAAQLSLGTMLHPTCQEDLIAAVALIRPGPVRGNVVQRFVEARNGYLRIEPLHPDLEPILRKTFGCVLYQEQADQVIAIICGYTPGEAEKFRKSLAGHAKLGTLEVAYKEFIRRAFLTYPKIGMARATYIYSQIEGWSGYGFAEGHAASFATIGYRTAYMSKHHPAPYFAGLMNHQPLGYYSNNSLASEARRRGCTIRPVDINASSDKCYAEEPNVIRLGLGLVRELRDQDVEAIVQAREKDGPFQSLLDFAVRVPLPFNCVENLILAGTFDTLHNHRRGLNFRLEDTLNLALSCRAVQANNNQTAFSFGSWKELRTPIAEDIQDFSPWESLMWEWRIAGVCSSAHPMRHLRPGLNKRGILTCLEAKQETLGEKVIVAGLNIRPHRPHTHSGNPVLFASLEDETALLQLVCLGEVIDRVTPTFLVAPAVVVAGEVERKGTGTMIKVTHARPLTMSEHSIKGRLTGQTGTRMDPVLTT
jgi:error-prone DNA polymerase